MENYQKEGEYIYHQNIKFEINMIDILKQKTRILFFLKYNIQFTLQTSCNLNPEYNLFSFVLQQLNHSQAYCYIPRVQPTGSLEEVIIVNS